MKTGRLLAIVSAGVLGCSGGGGPREGGGGSVPTATIEQVLLAHTDSVMALPGVVGIGIGSCEGKPCITVLLADSSPATKARIPERLGGYPVTTQVTGPIRPYNSLP